MRVACGCDHAGFVLKASVLAELASHGADVTDCGTDGTTCVDYPDFAAAVAGLVSRGEADRGVLVCGTGVGMCMTANRFRGVRAVVVTDDLTAEICRRHNDANIICLAGRTTPAGDAVRLLRIWLATPFDGGRHGRRVAKIDELSRRFTGDGPEE